MEHGPKLGGESVQLSRRQFGEENWKAVQRLLTALESYQIYYLDPRPHNIVFLDCEQRTQSGSPLE